MFFPKLSAGSKTKMVKSRPDANSAAAAQPALEEGMLPDFITGQPVKETPKELVRQEVALRPAARI